MDLKSVLPPGINIANLSLEECRHFKKMYELLESVTQDIQGPPGYRVFYPLLHCLLLYGICCIEEKKFPALNKCWNALSPLFLTPQYDCDWLVHCWIFCDFPLYLNKTEVLLDHFAHSLLEQQGLPADLGEHVRQFHTIMKASRLGLYQEILSTSKITKYRELFTHNVLTTVRSVPYYETGEIFLTRIISYLGDSFAIHDSKSYPAEAKEMLEEMVRDKMYFISPIRDEVTHYEQFMKLAGPYWMSCTHADPSIPVLFPDEYKNYY